VRICTLACLAGIVTSCIHSAGNCGPYVNVGDMNVTGGDLVDGRDAGMMDHVLLYVYFLTLTVTFRPCINVMSKLKLLNLRDHSAIFICIPKFRILFNTIGP
jgi:hypothetical protein